MALDPIIKGLLDAVDAMNAPPMSEGTPEEAREHFRSLALGLRQPHWIVPVASVEDTTFPGATQERAARIYRPEESTSVGTTPTVLFFHGGGHVIGDLETHDNQARTICRDTGSVVVSVDYRLAPEDPWPAAPDDCFASCEWVFDNITAFGGDARAVGVAGDSAGGNLAAVTAVRARDAGLTLRAQLLIYPVVDYSIEGPYPSRIELAEGYFLTLDDMAWFGEQYAGHGAPIDHPHLSPIHADFAGLPPAIVVAAEYDPLRDEAEAYASALTAAGVSAELIRAPGMIHGFFDLGGISPAAAALVKQCTESFASLLH